MNPAEHSFHPEVRFLCPFCGRACLAGFTRTPGEDDEPGLTHEKPTCVKFETLEIDEFLHQVNIQYGAHN